MAGALIEPSASEPFHDTDAARAHFSFPRSWPCYQFLLLLLIAAIWMARSPYSASNLEVPPDSVEYALAPIQVLETGRYEIIVEGRGLPPRYPPWFPLTVILPVYALLGAEPGNAILGITLFAVAGVGIAWAIGRKISGTTGGVLAALGVLVLPSYSAWATQVMSDVPCAVLFLAGCWLFLRIRAQPGRTRLGLFWIAGALVAIATLFRPVSAALLLPFAWAAIRPWKLSAALGRGAGLFVPMLGAVAATFAYNTATFGSPLRNGYHFWLLRAESMPLEPILAVSNLAGNFQVLLGTAFPILLGICVVTVLVLRKTKAGERLRAAAPLRDLALFISAAGIPVLLFHLFYFYQSDRFFLPIVAGVAVIAGSMLGLRLGDLDERITGALIVLLLFLVAFARIAVPEPLPQRRMASDRIRQNTPDDAIIISAIDPVFLQQRIGRGSARRILPLTRGVEYTFALFPPGYPSAKAQPTATTGIAAGPIIKFVATEQINQLVAEARHGRHLFLEASALETGDFGDALGLINSRFRMMRKAPALYELEPL